MEVVLIEVIIGMSDVDCIRFSHRRATGGSEVTSHHESSTCVCGKVSCRILFGLCHCGCGRKTETAMYSSRREKCTKGLPRRYCNGHGRRITRTDFSDASPFKIEGLYCKLIHLGRGFFAIVLEIDFASLSKFAWSARRDNASKAYYAIRNIDGGTIMMHRQILGDSVGVGMRGDHINGVTLDNRRPNLRPVTHAQNAWNQKTRSTNTSGRKGVSWMSHLQAWKACICVNRVEIYLGHFKYFREACTAREEAEVKYFGEFRRK